MSQNVSSGIETVSGTIIQAVTPVNLIGADSAYGSGRHFITDNSGALNVNISGGQLVTVTVTSGGTFNSAGFQSGTMVVVSGGQLSISGVAAETSGQAHSVFGYTPALVSGAVAVNVQSGASTLHTVTVNAYGASGGQVEIRNATSGVAGNIVGTISAGANSGVFLSPATLIYDIQMLSGIVVSTSGALWNLTVSYRNPV